MLLRVIAVTAAILAFMTTGGSRGALAQTFDVKVKSGVSTLVGDFFVVSREDCSAQAIPDARVRTQGRNGRAEVRRARGRLQSFCAGAIVNGVQFYYVSARGYRGADEVVIDIPWETYVDAASRSMRTHTYRITVE